MVNSGLCFVEIPSFPVILVQTGYPFVSADEKTFEIQFKGDAQVQIDVQGVVMSTERLGCGASRYLMHHRSFDFNKAIIFEIIPQCLYDGASLCEDVFHLGDLRLGRRTFGGISVQHP